MDQIIAIFTTLPPAERARTVAALARMHTPLSPASPPAKKKVNGFIGFRTYYSPLFAYLPQKARSPMLTTLWRADPAHAEWDFTCAVFSAVRLLLERERVAFRQWVDVAVRALAIVPRDAYLHTIGWQVGGEGELQRVEGGLAPTPRAGAMDAAGLLTACLACGLAVADPTPLFACLAGQNILLLLPPAHARGPVQHLPSHHGSSGHYFDMGVPLIPAYDTDPTGAPTLKQQGDMFGPFP